ncbi:MAG TPA: hypothetical protein VN706_15580 [Gemmatimonadaceae bacterium]|nr:hypothetical protein [Gemmatimonadaceae bacterium]
MSMVTTALRSSYRLSLAAVVAIGAGCTHGMPGSSSASMPGPVQAGAPSDNRSPGAPNPDPRVGLKSGLWNAGQAEWNMRLLSNTHPSAQFNNTNSDLAFVGPYAIQGNYNGFQIWDISTPTAPRLAEAYFCPASQSDVSVYRNLLFVSSEATSGRLDCRGGGLSEPVSNERIRGLRIFDITDLSHPKYVGNVQTCRGSHTHTLLVDPRDRDNVYVYISGSSGVRPAAELAGCSAAAPASDPNSALFRIEVIQVPLAHPEQAHIVSSPRIFNNLTPPAHHGLSEPDSVEVAASRARGQYDVDVFGMRYILPPAMTKPLIDSIARSNGHRAATQSDSAALRGSIQEIANKQFGIDPKSGPTQCHDITVYPAIGLAGGACEGYGMLLDIRDPAHPSRIAAVSDSNFSYWHSATFNNDGTKVLFSDEWGGGGQPKCRAGDPRQWGADALFTIDGNRRLQFQGYYKLPAIQTAEENCVAHNGSLIPIPGRDVMVQAWYQGGVSVFDWTDPRNAREIAFFDRGPIDSTRMIGGGEWSVYWYNGVLVGSEIARGLDVFELTPSPYLSQNEIDAAKSVHLDYLNTQGQPKFTWPATFSLARAYLDQLGRSNGLAAARLAAVRQSLAGAEGVSGAARSTALSTLASQLDGDAGHSSDAPKVRLLAQAVRDLAR